MNLILKTIVAAGIAACVYVTPTLALDGVETRQVKGSFEDIYFELKNAIVDKGLVIDTVLHVSDMLNRTGKDVGSTKPVYLHGQTLGFCSAKLSRAAMEADLASLAFCPYSIFIYEAAAAPNAITIGYRKLSGGTSPRSQEALGAINDLLSSIVKGVTGD